MIALSSWSSFRDHFSLSGSCFWMLRNWNWQSHGSFPKNKLDRYPHSSVA